MYLQKSLLIQDTTSTILDPTQYFDSAINIITRITVDMYFTRSRY